jgi:elongation factor Ts
MSTTQALKELRTRTGCGIVDCQEALKDANGSLEEAIVLLRKKGKAKATKKADRETREGVIASYVHGNGKIAVLVSLLCETDFVARTDRFKTLARDIALHIAAAEPLVVDPSDIAEDAVAVERAVAEEQARASGKPEAIQAKIVEGKLDSFRQERALLTQPFVKDPSKTVGDLLREAVSELGENISVGQFSRLAI